MRRFTVQSMSVSAFAIASLLVAWLTVGLGSTRAFADELPRPTLVVVLGAPGAPEFEEPFRKWAGQWKAAAERGGASCVVIGDQPAGGVEDREQLKTQLEAAAQSKSSSALWLVMIGHGTFDGKVARFSLRGPDVSSSDLKGWLQPIERPIAIVDCSACSGPFLAELSGRDRAVITATRAGSEYNFAHFGEFLAGAIADPAADLDKDQQTSLLEAFVVAGSRLREFYASQARLATEHPLLDDNGDKLGTPVDWFQGLRPTKAAKSGATLDGALAASFVLSPGDREQRLTVEQRVRRDALERELAALRASRATLSEADYLSKLEPVLVELAKLYASRE